MYGFMKSVWILSLWMNYCHQWINVCSIKKLSHSVMLTFQRPHEEKSPVGPWLLALFLFVVCGSGDYTGTLVWESEYLNNTVFASCLSFLDLSHNPWYDFVIFMYKINCTEVLDLLGLILPFPQPYPRSYKASVWACESWVCLELHSPTTSSHSPFLPLTKALENLEEDWRLQIHSFLQLVDETWHGIMCTWPCGYCVYIVSRKVVSLFGNFPSHLSLHGRCISLEMCHNYVYVSIYRCVCVWERDFFSNKYWMHLPSVYCQFSIAVAQDPSEYSVCDMGMALTSMYPKLELNWNFRKCISASAFYLFPGLLLWHTFPPH